MKRKSGDFEKAVGSLLLAMLLWTWPGNARGQFSLVGAHSEHVTKYENIVYGMISGMALLMDVYQPDHGNHLGILAIPGSGYGYFPMYQKVYNQRPLKDDYVLDTAYGAKWMQALVKLGYTLFVINHRFAPRYHYPDPFYDCQRAARFVRYHARRFGIDGAHIGAIGHSSGATFTVQLAQRDTTISRAEDPADSMSSKVQAVVAFAGQYNLADFNTLADSGGLRALVITSLANYMGELPASDRKDFILSGKYAEASPISYVRGDNAPMLLFHSENDPIVPARQATALFTELEALQVPCRLVMSIGEGHEPRPDIGAVDDWFRRYLK